MEHFQSSSFVLYSEFRTTRNKKDLILPKLNLELKKKTSVAGMKFLIYVPKTCKNTDNIKIFKFKLN